MAEAKKIDNMVRHAPKVIRKLLRSHWNSVPKEAMHLTGEPSTAKSYCVWEESMALAKENDREFFNWNRESLERKHDCVENPKKYFIFADVRATETDVGELRLQNMNNNEAYITFKYNQLFVALSDNDAMGVLFLDELNNAPDFQKTQFYKIINDRAIGDIPIGDGVLIVSAGNEISQASNVTEDPVPLVLRRANYFIQPPTGQEFVEWAGLNDVHPWVIGYIAWQPMNVHKIAYDNPNPIGQPCTRTWTKLSNVLKGNKDLSENDISMLACGYVGQGIGIEFTKYTVMANKVNIDEVLENPSLVKKLEGQKELSIVYALMMGIVDRYKNAKGEKRTKLIGQAIDVAMQMRVEMSVFMMRQMKYVNQEAFFANVVSHPKFITAFTEETKKYFSGSD
jgi:hypothetical protein